MILKKLMTQVRGLSYSRKDVIKTSASNYVPVLRAGNIQQGRIIEENYVYVPKKLIKERQFLKRGDILIAASSGSISIVGKAAMIENDMEATFGAFCKVLRPENNLVEQQYFKHYFETLYYKRTIKSLAEGANINNLKTDHFDNLKIPLPPLAEQKRIANILDQADQLRQLNQQILAEYDALTKSLFLDMFGDPVVNPMGWEKVELKECNSKIGSGSTPKGGKESYKNEGISLVRSMNIHDTYFKYKGLAFIDNNQADKLKNVIVEEEDVLFNITGASVCRCTIVPNDILPARVNQHVAILRPRKEKLDSIFLNYLLISENCKNKLLGISIQGGATREAITKESLQGFKIPLPPIALQNKFAQKIKNIEAQKAKVQAALAASEDLFNNLLQKAFKGEL